MNHRFAQVAATLALLAVSLAHAADTVGAGKPAAKPGAGSASKASPPAAVAKPLAGGGIEPPAKADLRVKGKDEKRIFPPRPRWDEVNPAGAGTVRPIEDQPARPQKPLK